MTTSTLAGLFQDRHGVGDGACRLAAAVPAHHDAVELERRFLDIGHDDHRPAGLEQRAFGDQLFDLVSLRFGLGDDGEIEAPRDAGELVAGAGGAGAERDRLGRNAGARGRRGEPVDGGFRRGLVVGQLRLDDFGRDIAGARNRHDRIEHECDPGDVGAKGIGDRNRIVADDTAVLARAEIDDNVLDHGGVSSVRQGHGRQAYSVFMSCPLPVAFAPNQSAGPTRAATSF